jgi:FMNH2-dependent dimethyl sulfone monooxygenase
MDVKFAYWATNLGGLVFSEVPQEAGWTFDYNAWLAQTAEDVGFDYTLVAARFILTGGSGEHLEALSTTAALAPVTKRIKLITAIHSGLWHPGVIAKVGATIDHISNGRFGVNVVSGWFKKEFLTYGEPWLDHDERYRRSEEFIQVLRGMWTQDRFSFSGDFYRIHDAWLQPMPVAQPHPEIFQGGNSKAARSMAARFSDWYFMNGDSVEGAREQIAEINEMAREHGRHPRFAINAFVIVRDSDEEAQHELERIISNANLEAVEAFAAQVKNAGASTQDAIGMWANSDLANMVQPNDGFKTGLIGTPTRVAERIREYYEAGVDMILCGFLNFTEELPTFGRTVIPLARELDSRRPAVPAAIVTT